MAARGSSRWVFWGATGAPLEADHWRDGTPCRPISIASTAGVADWAVPDGSWCLISAVDTHWQGPAGSGPMAVAALTAGEMSLQRDGLGPGQVCLLALEKVGIKTLAHASDEKRVCRLVLGPAIWTPPPPFASAPSRRWSLEMAGGWPRRRGQIRPSSAISPNQAGLMQDNSQTTHGQLTVAFGAPLGLSYHVAFSLAWWNAPFSVESWDQEILTLLVL